LIQETQDEDIGEAKNEALNCKTLVSLIPKTFYHIMNLFMVYYFEYVIITSFANVMDHKIKAENQDQLQETWVKHYFVILNVMYQIGVFISRSSLHFIEIKKIWILTLI
jgi:hypothetical protein